MTILLIFLFIFLPIFYKFFIYSIYILLYFKKIFTDYFIMLFITYKLLLLNNTSYNNKYYNLLPFNNLKIYLHSKYLKLFTFFNI